MKKERKFLRIKCSNHKYPFENIITLTTELEDIIKCGLCNQVIYNPFFTSGDTTYYFDYTNINIGTNDN